ncbi:sensor histidine kinase [Aquibacillus sediminis]|uniref:sensor histidine kinase n=1 Tax=Aquibacillus sediminis TaxID=2574734 RepID=UPI0011093782|nr:sensor histidine kinase [Aquibacillus sediminis]
MKTIRSKLFVYFLVFVALFNVVSLSIYVSSSKLMDEYHGSFEHFLLFNSISQTSNELYENTKSYVLEQEDQNLTNYYQTFAKLEIEKDQLRSVQDNDQIQLKNYLNMIESHMRQSELTVGFVIRDDMERYTLHLNELENINAYIQDMTLTLIDMELTNYQSFYMDMQDRENTFQWFIVFLFVTTVLFAIVIAISLTDGITKPIQQLSTAAKQVSAGKFDGEPVTIASNDELKLLGDSFNTMRTNIRDLISEMKDKSEQERLMKELELKHLQNQVNPHFLFNTLNTISKMAYLEDAKSTSNLIDSAATLLRHSLGDLEKFVRLEDEVKVVQEYITIQKTRFMERMEFSIAIDESCLSIPVPRLTLQPIVENAFIHGLEPVEQGGKLAITINQTEEHVVVEVNDNGIGMTEEQVNRILSLSKPEDEEHVGHSTGLGMTNVIRRLQLFYQQEDVIEIDSQVGQGSSIRLLLPKDVL